MKKGIFISIIMLLLTTLIWAQSKTVTGVVAEESTGSPLPGVSIVEQGTNNGTITGEDGSFSIVTESNNAILEFSFIGFKTIEVNVENKSKVNIIMIEDAEMLGEVVVTALGIKREQKALGYAVSTIKSSDLVNVGSTNFGSALYGKAAGVSIQSAPGGATSAVNIKIRGTNSINFSSQPLIVMDGIPIRNGDANNDGYWSDQRIRGNGLVDINPEEIESISILKGASASALYGSEAANGVVLITSKKGVKRPGLGVEASYTFKSENPAFNPPFQNEYGPGYDYVTNMEQFGSDENGWVYEDLDGDGIKETPRPIYRSYAQFGPKFDGREVIGWDNQMHPYVAQPDNWDNMFQRGFSSVANVAINKVGEFGSLRFSYNRTDYKPLVRGSNHNKNNLSLNTNIKLHEKLKLDLMVNYINQYTLNRPYKMNRLTNNYGGFFSRFDDMNWYLDNYKTSLGYKFRTGSQASATPEENLNYSPRATDLLDYFWRTLACKNEEYSDRLITSTTATWDIIDGLKLRGRIGNDFTSMVTEDRQPNPIPISIGNGGMFGMQTNKYSILYGDALLNYDKKLNKDFNLVLNAGFQGRKEQMNKSSIRTDGGLSSENWYHFNASINPLRGVPDQSAYTEFVKYAFLGTASLGYRNYAFIEVTGRQETSSTLPPKNNTFFYPSINGSLIFSELLELPSAIDFGKLRLAWGIVGNAPPMYAANNAYTQSSINGIVFNSVSNNYGNDLIRPEEKYEFEVGLEMKFLENRLGFEATYYDNTIKDQILNLTIPNSTGAEKMLTNIGELRNYGYEFSLYGTPIRTKDINWELRGNFAINKNEVISLMDGVDRLEHKEIDVRSALIVSEPGRPMGDIYAWVPKTNEAGQKIVDPETGLYQMNFDEQKRVGNVTPDIVGGFGTSLTYKNLFMDLAFDYKFGGDIINVAGQYMKSAGLFESTLQYRDKARGGLPYYRTDDNTIVPITDGTQVPNGRTVFNDGVVLSGVNPDGSPNDVMTTAADYYNGTYYWSSHPTYNPTGRYDLAVQKNDYIKFREFSIGYHIPKSVAQKIGCQKLSISFMASNLFYLYRTLDEFDPETTLGTNWVNAAVVEGSTSASRSYGFSIKAGF